VRTCALVHRRLVNRGKTSVECRGRCASAITFSFAVSCTFLREQELHASAQRRAARLLAELPADLEDATDAAESGAGLASLPADGAAAAADSTTHGAGDGVSDTEIAAIVARRAAEEAAPVPAVAAMGARGDSGQDTAIAQATASGGERRGGTAGPEGNTGESKQAKDFVRLNMAEVWGGGRGERGRHCQAWG